MKEVRTGTPETETLKKRGSTVEQAPSLRETKEKQNRLLFPSPPSKVGKVEREAYAGIEAFSGIFDALKSDGQSPRQQTEQSHWRSTNTLSQEKLDRGKRILEEMYAAMTPEERERRREEQKWRKAREQQWKEFEEGKRDAPPGKMKIEAQGSYQFVDTPEEIARKRATIPPEKMKRFREIVDKPTDKLTEDDWQVLTDRSQLYTFFETLDESERTKWGYKQEEISKEQWNKFLAFGREIYKHRQREKAAWMHERDPRYDPMTGDLLDPNERPLDPKCEYTFDGKTRARSFVHSEARSFLSPDSPLLNHRKPLQTDGKEEEPEIPSHERLIQRLLKAGFIEVEPTLMDKAHFERTQWYRNLSPAEKMAYLDEEMRKMRGENPWDKETIWEKAGEKFAKFIQLLIDFLIALIAPEIAEKVIRGQPAQKPV